MLCLVGISLMCIRVEGVSDGIYKCSQQNLLKWYLYYEVLQNDLTAGERNRV